MELTTIDRGDVANLPEGSRIQKINNTIYVYFLYSYSVDGKQKQERDYIGKVNLDLMAFCPNDYYELKKPTLDNRPLDRWKNTEKRKREEEKLARKQAMSSEYRPHEDMAPSMKIVGSTALAMKILEQTGMAVDVGQSIFEGHVIDTMKLLNLAMHAAITSEATYLAKSESAAMRFIGKGCPTSQRASEFFNRIGNGLDLSEKIGRARVARLGKNEILALDGTRLDSNSDNIAISEAGKRKRGGFGRQISFSMLANANTGEAIGYRYYAGNLADGRTLDDFLTIWEGIGISDKDPVIVMDRAYGSAENIVKLCGYQCQFIVGLKSNLVPVQAIIKSHNPEFSSVLNLLEHADCYAVQDKATFTHAGKSNQVDVYVYCDPNKVAKEGRKFKEDLRIFEEDWKKGKCDFKSKLLQFFKNPKEGRPLVRDNYLIEQEGYLLGFFALASNDSKLNVESALYDYDLRSEVEVLFGMMFKHIIHSTRVQTMGNLEGLLLVAFVALNILTTLRTRMKHPLPASRKNKTKSSISDNYTITQLLRQFNHIILHRTNMGKVHLLNVNSQDRKLAQALGLGDLFSSAEEVDKLLSAGHLAEILKGSGQ